MRDGKFWKRFTFEKVIKLPRRIFCELTLAGAVDVLWWFFFGQFS
jgi:hypothetical protein